MTSLIDTFSSELFTFDGKSRKFIGEASSLNRGRFSSNMIAIKSARTGQTQTFRRVETKRDAENDITSWEFVISATDAGLDPSLKGLTLTVYND